MKPGAERLRGQGTARQAIAEGSDRRYGFAVSYSGKRADLVQ